MKQKHIILSIIIIICLHIFTFSASSEVIYSQDFSNGKPGGKWTYYSDNSGRIEVVDGRLRMDSNWSESLNEAIITLNLSSFKNISLSFNQKSFPEPIDSIPEQFTKHHNGDGISISVNGETWYCITNSLNLNQNNTFQINLDLNIQQIRSKFDPSFGFTNTFKIKFQQFDDGPADSDGREWDDIKITGTNVPLKISIPANVREDDGIMKNQGQVSIINNLHSSNKNIVVNLTNSNPTEIQIPTQITIPTGQNTAEFDIKIIDNSILDNNQTATITAFSYWNSSSATISIQDNEENTIQFQTKTQMRNQDGETSITIIHTGTGEASIDYTTLDGTAISGQDYLPTSGTLNFAPNEQQKDIKVIILDKPLRTTDTNFSIKLSNPSGASLGNNDTTTITISGRLAITQSYTQNFNSMPGSSWQYLSSNNFGRIQVVDGRLKMDTWKAKETILNEAELSLNLAWAQNVSLSFEHWKHYEAEDHAMPEAYTEHCNADGIAVSNDGYQWYRIINANELGDNGNKVQVDLNEKISNIQKTLDSTFSFSDNFIVRFQHYDTNTFGREWDNITINVMGDTLALDSGIEGQPDEPFIIPLHLSNANHQPIKGIYALLSFDSNVLIPKTAYLDGGILDTENYQVYVDTSVPGEMLISLFSNSDQYCYSSGIVAFLEFTAGSTMYLTSTVAFSMADVNESPVNARAGAFKIMNYSPEISAISDVFIEEDMTSRPIPFTISDTETPADQLIITATSSNEQLVPIDSAHFSFGGTHQERHMIITPAHNFSGTTTIKVTVMDEKGLKQTQSFDLSVIAIPDHPILDVVLLTSGKEDMPIPLTISTRLADNDGSETLSDVTVLSVPAGATLTAGTNQFDGSWLVSKDMLTDLCIIPSENNDLDFTLTIQISSTEQMTNKSSLTEKNIQVIVHEQADQPQLQLPASITGNADVPFPLDIMAVRTDQDGSESLFMKISGMPAGASLSKGIDHGDGSWTISEADIPGLTMIPPQQDDRDFSLSIIITVSEISGDKRVINHTLHVSVTGHAISGNVRYFSNDLPVGNVLMTLAGNFTYTTLTDDSGHYQFHAVSPGYYKLIPQKSDDLGGVSQTDASDISRYIVRSSPLNCFQKIAADVSQNQLIRPTDVSAVSIYAIPGKTYEMNDSHLNWQFSTGISSSCTGDHVAYTPYRQYHFLNKNYVNADFVAVRLGDVTGNWRPDSLAAEPESHAPQFQARMVKRSAADPGKPFTVAVALENETDIRGVDIVLTFDSSVIRGVSANLSGTILENEEFVLQFDTSIDGQVYAGLYGSDHMVSGKGEILFINFDFIGADDAKSPLNFMRFDINESMASGGFLVGNRLSKKVSVVIDDGVPQLEDNEAPIFTLSIVNNGNGVVRVNDTDYTQTVNLETHEGDKLSIRATPAERFKYWSGHVETSDNPLTLEMDGHKSIQVNWCPILSVDHTGQGSIIINDILYEMPFQLPICQDGPTYLKPLPASDWQFAYWSDSMTLPQEQRVLYITDNMHIGLTFIPIPMHTISIQGEGSVKVNGVKHTLPSNLSFSEGTSLTINGIPTCDGLVWRGDYTGVDNPIILTVDHPIQLTAGCNQKLWEANVSIEVASTHCGDYRTGIVIGEAEYGIQIPSPPKPPCPLPYLSLTPDWESNLSQELKATGADTYSWIFAVDLAGFNELEQITLTWNPLDLDPNAVYQLMEGYNGNGKMVISDMHAYSSLTLTNNRTTSYYTILMWKNQVCMQIDLTKGWNLISVPMQARDMQSNAIFPDAVVAYGFEQGGYQIARTIDPSKGYWVNVLKQKNYDICGIPFNGYSDILDPGWHLRGSGYTNNQPLSEPMDAMQVIYAYKDGEYQIVRTFMPGMGYWVNFKKNGSLIVKGK